MSTAPAYLGIDLGTSSVKAMVTDAGGAVLASATRDYPVLAPAPGRAESDPERWWSAVVAACREAVPAAGRPVAGIGLSGQMHGTVLTDDAGTALRPAVLHPDTRARGELEAYRVLGADARRRLANPLSPNMAGPVLCWLRDHEPVTYRAARWALQPKDWLRLRLTGTAAAEPSDASATLLHDVAADRWDDDVVAALGLRRELLAPLLPHSGALAGPLLPAAAAALGVPAGTPVAAGGGDTAVAVLGSGLAAPGEAVLTVGTGGQAVVLLDHAGGDPAAGTQLHRTTAVRGWYAMGAILNAGLALDWVRRSTGATWADVYGAASLPAREDDPVFLPHLVGERAPRLDPGLRAAWVGLGLQHERADLLRAALEGVAHALADALDALPLARAVPVRLAGGGTTDPVWRQLLCDTVDRPLHHVPVPAASSRGAAVLGAVAAGACPPEEAAVRLAPGPGDLRLPEPSAAAQARERRDRLHELQRTLSPTALL